MSVLHDATLKKDLMHLLFYDIQTKLKSILSCCHLQTQFL